MKVYGMLEQGGMELLVGAPSTGNFTGRMYMDVTIGTAGVPYVYNGTQYLQLATVATALPNLVVIAASTTAVTINWASGLNQQVILSANCTISFSNPVANSVHTLIVTQVAHTAATANPIYYTYNFNVPDIDSKRQPYQPTQVLVPGESATYSWFYKAGVKAAYTTIGSNAQQKLFHNASQALYNASFSPDGKALAIGSSSSPFTNVYQISDCSVNDRSPMGIGNNIPVSAPGGVQVIPAIYSPDGDKFVIGISSSPYFFLQEVVSNGPQAYCSNPATGPTGAIYCAAWHPSADFFAVGGNTSPYLNVYQVGNPPIALANPASLPAGQVAGVAFSPLGDYLAVSMLTTPFIKVYAFTVTAGGVATIGAASSNPATLPGSCTTNVVGKSIAWNPAGTYIAMVMNTAPWIYVVPFNRTTGVFGARLTPTTAPTGMCTCVQWTPDGQYLVVGGSTAPTYMYIYDFSASTLGGLVTTDNFNPTQAVNDVAIHPSGDYAVLTYSGTPYMTAFALPTKVRNYLSLK